MSIALLSLLYTIFKYYIFSIHTRDTAIRQSVPIEYLQNVDLCRISDLQFSCPKAADFVASTVGIVIRQHAVYIHIRPDCQTVFYIHTHIVNTHTHTQTYTHTKTYIQIMCKL